MKIICKMHPAKIVGVEYDFYEQQTEEAEDGVCTETFPQGLGFRLVYDLLDTGERYFAYPYPEIALALLDDGFPGLSAGLIQDPYSVLGKIGKIRIYNFQT
jgi:hypothetical protein